MTYVDCIGYLSIENISDKLSNKLGLHLEDVFVASADQNEALIDLSNAVFFDHGGGAPMNVITCAKGDYSIWIITIGGDLMPVPQETLDQLK